MCIRDRSKPAINIGRFASFISFLAVSSSTPSAGTAGDGVLRTSRGFSSETSAACCYFEAMLIGTSTCTGPGCPSIEIETALSMETSTMPSTTLMLALVTDFNSSP